MNFDITKYLKNKDITITIKFDDSAAGTITDIYNELNYDRGTIINNCKGRTKSSHGFIWKYYEEECVA